MINFSFGTNGKSIYLYLSVPILKHITVISGIVLIFYVKALVTQSVTFSIQFLESFPLHNNLKSLDPYDKTDLDLFGIILEEETHTLNNIYLQ